MPAKSPGIRVREQIDYRLRNFWTCIPAIIREIDYEKLRCKVQIKVKPTDIEPPIIAEVPFALQKGKDCTIIPDYAVGDVVLVVFSRYALDKILIDKEVRDPEIKRQFAISDAIIVGGLFVKNDDIPQKDDERDFTIIRKTDSGFSQIILKENGDILLKTDGRIFLNCDETTGRKVCRVGDKDSDGDTMIEGAERVFA